MLAHLGMSGQFRVVDREAPRHRHTRVVIGLGDDRDLRFLDQRTFGGLTLAPLVDDVPGPVAHIAPDPFEDSTTARTQVDHQAQPARPDTGIRYRQHLCRRNPVAGSSSPGDPVLAPQPAQGCGVVGDSS